MARPTPSFSLRRTLAVRFSLTMFVALLGLALWAFLGVRHTLREQVDQSLRGSAQLQVTSIAALSGAAAHQELPVDCFVRDVNRFVAVRDSTGRILASNTRTAGDLPLQAAAFQESRRFGSGLASQQWLGGEFRSIYVAMPRSASSPASVVQVGASLTPLQASLNTILLQMLTIVMVGTLATAVGAGWLARSAVAPVQAITDQARTITGEVPGQRITAHADVSEFHGLTEVINAMVARLERASLWHRRIIRDLGHDLRTPVTAMRAGVEVALWSERSPEDYRRILASTLEEIDRLSLISDALVFLGRLQAGQVSLDLAQIDARVLAEEAIAGAQESVSEHSIEMVTPEEPVLIRGDARLMKMVLEQLLDNARRYTPPGSHIRLRVGTNEDNAILEVEDDGPGVGDEVLPHLFEPFYRSDTARAREGGPGLGLTATAAIVALHGGTVVAQRGSPQGLLVTVALPRPEDGNPSVSSELPQRAGAASSRMPPA